MEEEKISRSTKILAHVFFGFILSIFILLFTFAGIETNRLEKENPIPSNMEELITIRKDGHYYYVDDCTIEAGTITFSNYYYRIHNYYPFMRETLTLDAPWAIIENE